MLSRSYVRCSRRLSSLIQVHPTVSEALAQKKPVVALESTVITHGLPYPKNLEIARSLESIVREENAVPATIALLHGQICVGLESDQVEELAAPGNGAIKVSTRDIPTVLASRSIGGTTVAATMKIAHLAGIRVFATGGIGGVHRGAEQTFDVSADLVELGRTPVAVVCAGAKSILDIRKTLEVLETQGVNVVVLDKRPLFPGFFVSRTPFKAPFHTESVEKVAEILRMTDAVGLNHGTLVACPLSSEFEKDSELVEKAVDQALKEAVEADIQNKDLTPFLLSRVNQLTNSKSLQLSTVYFDESLLKNNARIASRLAASYCRPGHPIRSPAAPAPPPSPPRVFCVGASILDFEVLSETRPKDDGGSYPSQLFTRPGGVGRNHAHALHQLGNRVDLLTAIGSDAPGVLLRQLGLQFVSAETLIVSRSHSTAAYLSVNVGGNIQHGFSAIGSILSEIDGTKLELHKERMAASQFLVLDGNLPHATFHDICRIATDLQKPVWFDPADIAKVNRIESEDVIKAISVFTPNLNEFKAYCGLRSLPAIPDDNLADANELAEYLSRRLSLVRQLMPSTMVKMLVTLGAGGVCLLSRPERGADVVEMRTIESPLIKTEQFVSASGAGDCFNAAFLSAMLLGRTDQACLEAGQKAAQLSLKSSSAVPADLTPDSVLN